jgi:hypothetical protein
MINCLNAK